MNVKHYLSSFALFLSSAAVLAAPITFMSGTDDGCNYTAACLLDDTATGTYINPDDHAELLGASWIQPTGTWNQAGAEYRIWELDLDRLSQDMRVESLFVAFDDDLQIRSRGELLVEIARFDVPNGNPWKQLINVFDYTTEALIIDAGARLNFWVTNSGNGPTGLVYKGTANEVFEPSTWALLGLGLVGLSFARRSSVAL
jgi:hypothetical protein